jgi:segregation and condensation protein A
LVRPDYTVQLSRVFQGPLDLLLHLVREQEVDIIEIEISKILGGYLAFLENLEQLDVEYAGDFLVMAATLMSIKSRSLLPSEEVDLDEELDPRDELIQRLVEYRRFKGVADELDEAWKIRENQAERGFFPEMGAFKVEHEYDLSELTAFDLATNFARLKRETLADSSHHIESDPRPLRFYVGKVVDCLRAGHHGSLRNLLASFDGMPKREALVGSFCALLELVKIEVVSVEQNKGTRELEITLRTDNAGRIDELLAVFEEENLSEEAQSAVAEGQPSESTSSDHASGSEA